MFVSTAANTAVLAGSAAAMLLLLLLLLLRFHECRFALSSELLTLMKKLLENRLLVRCLCRGLCSGVPARVANNWLIRKRVSCVHQGCARVRVCVCDNDREDGIRPLRVVISTCMP